MRHGHYGPRYLSIGRRGRRFADERRFRACEYQWNKVETFEEMCWRVELGEE